MSKNSPLVDVEIERNRREKEQLLVGFKPMITGLLGTCSTGVLLTPAVSTSGIQSY